MEREMVVTPGLLSLSYRYHNLVLIFVNDNSRPKTHKLSTAVFALHAFRTVENEEVANLRIIPRVSCPNVALCEGCMFVVFLDTHFLEALGSLPRPQN